ncbi:hypothetical protein OESDEN_15308 [Oesophagostomum dentatum]|uniref:Uncharacterized protein n=1 Tax=Oesophagostomum dentatum TaxID=61180 RepID=A0A0B1SN73_OESDE|nr:hypothetical protein OESDEN_15308 [Oesophagostomum dentatum]
MQHLHIYLFIIQCQSNFTPSRVTRRPCPVSCSCAAVSMDLYNNVVAARVGSTSESYRTIQVWVLVSFFWYS